MAVCLLAAAIWTAAACSGGGAAEPDGGIRDVLPEDAELADADDAELPDSAVTETTMFG